MFIHSTSSATTVDIVPCCCSPLYNTWYVFLITNDTSLEEWIGKSCGGRHIVKLSRGAVHIQNSALKYGEMGNLINDMRMWAGHRLIEFDMEILINVRSLLLFSVDSLFLCTIIDTLLNLLVSWTLVLHFFLLHHRIQCQNVTGLSSKRHKIQCRTTLSSSSSRLTLWEWNSNEC